MATNRDGTEIAGDLAIEPLSESEAEGNALAGTLLTGFQEYLSVDGEVDGDSAFFDIESLTTVEYSLDEAAYVTLGASELTVEDLEDGEHTITLRLVDWPYIFYTHTWTVGGAMPAGMIRLSDVMRYNEPLALRRRIAVYLMDQVTRGPVTGATPTGSQLMVSVNGDAPAEASGSWIETGGGCYYYVASRAESQADSFLMLRVAWPGARIFVFAVNIDARIPLGEPLESARRIPVYLEDAAGESVTSLVTTGAERQLSRNGTAFVNCVNDLVEIGLGMYYWTVTVSEINAQGYGLLKVVKSPALPYVYRFPVIAGVAVVPDTIPSPYSFDDPEYVDHLESMLALLPEQFSSPD